MAETTPKKKTRRFGLSLLDGSPLREDKAAAEEKNDVSVDHKMIIDEALQWKTELENLNDNMISAILENIQQKDNFIMVGVGMQE